MASTACVVASRKMMMFTTMSRNGTMFSSPMASDGSGSWCTVRLRT
ncbi:MAG: hypothetical protein M5U28_33945 [Sandaracinaceae bacterium]|nr:hypothetical protein [Sandaracinaceae bacterium]